jgi:hypothetical protein
VLDRLIDPLRHPEFLPGILAGALACAVFVAALRRVPRAAPLAGWLLAAATSAALAWLGLVTVGLVTGLVLVAGAGLLGHGRWASAAPYRPRQAVAALLAFAGIVLLTEALGTGTPAWRLLVASAGLGFVAALSGFDRGSRHRGLAPVLLLLTAGGIYATVPDTEQARVLLAVALPLAVLVRPARSATLGRAGAVVVGGLFVWVVVTGGHGRPGSIVGGLACGGLLLADPVARGLAGRTLLDRVPLGPVGGLGVGSAHLVVVLVASRVAGLRDSAAAAAFVAVGLLVAVVAVLVAGGRGGRRLRSPTG